MVGVDSEFYGFEISVDEAAYLIDRIDLGAPLPEVLAPLQPDVQPPTSVSGGTHCKASG